METTMARIETKQGNNVINARDLHVRLESKKDFSDWFKLKIKLCNLSENVDYQLLGNLLPLKGERNDTLNHFEVEQKKHGGQNRKEYALTQDSAIQICFSESTDKGKEVAKEILNKLKEETEAYKQVAQNQLPNEITQGLIDFMKEQTAALKELSKSTKKTLKKALKEKKPKQRPVYNNYNKPFVKKEIPLNKEEKDRNRLMDWIFEKASLSQNRGSFNFSMDECKHVTGMNAQEILKAFDAIESLNVLNIEKNGQYIQVISVKHLKYNRN